jgi:hypothetical protein
MRHVNEKRITETIVLDVVVAVLLFVVFISITASRFSTRFLQTNTGAHHSIHVVAYVDELTVPVVLSQTLYTISAFFEKRKDIQYYTYSNARKSFVIHDTHLYHDEMFTSSDAAFKYHLRSFFHSPSTAFLFVDCKGDLQSAHLKKNLHISFRKQKSTFIPIDTGITYVTARHLTKYQKTSFQNEDTPFSKILEDPEKYGNIPPKSFNNIFMFWDKGWENAPYLAQQAKNSWILHNDNSWNVILLDDSNIKHYLDDSVFKLIQMQKKIAIQAKTDIYRLNLLRSYGGVWADASILCFDSLDSWLPNSTFFAYSGYGTWPPPKRNAVIKWPVIWFLVAREPQLVIVDAWARATEEFWTHHRQSRKIKYEYFWLDSLFQEVYAANETVAAEWDAVPRLSAMDPDTGPTKYAESMLSRTNAEYFEDQKHPHIAKMSFRKIHYDSLQNAPGRFRRTIGYDVIQKALTNKV